MLSLTVFVLTDHHSDALRDALAALPVDVREFVVVDVFLAALKLETSHACAIVDVQDTCVALNVQRMAQAEQTSVPFLFLVNQAQETFAKSLVRGGAIRVLERPFAAEELQATLDEAGLVSDAYRAFAESGLHRTRLESLNERERRIVQLAADGTPNKRIAAILGLSVKTVEKQRRQAYQHLHVGSTAEMTRVVTMGNLHPLLHVSEDATPAGTTTVS